ncbi:MAG: hypothetical protein ABFR31_11255 [Thermodesulfobacteriota bacterium]
MNDFLQNLRNGQAEKQRPQRTRKSYDNSYHYTNPRFHSHGGHQNSRHQQMKRPSAQPQGGNQPSADENLVTSMLTETVEILISHIETLAKNQDYMVKAQEKSANMLERQVNAVERILNHLNIAPLQERAPEKKKTAKTIFENNYVTSPKSKPDTPVPSKISSKSPVKNINPAKPLIRRKRKIVANKSAETASTNSKLLGREAIMKIIYTMREEGATFDQIAVHLVELGQPTFSGRGEWHAQTIHRLCYKK